MTTSKAFLLAVLCGSVLVLGPFPSFIGFAQDDSDSQAQIAAVIERYSSGSLDRIWYGALTLEGFGEAAIPACRSLLMGESSKQRLMGAKTLISLGETQKVETTLRDLAADTKLEDEERAAAIQLLVNFPSTKTNALLKSFLEGEEAYNATLRINAAKVLFKASRDRLARSSLMPLLKVDDGRVRGQAAIALGEMGYVEGQCRAVLQSLSQEPSSAGAQARMILQADVLMRKLLAEPSSSGDANLEQNRLIEKLERDLAKKDQEISELKDRIGRGGGSFPLIQEVLEQIQALYADPDRVDREDLIVAAIKGMVSSLDPFSQFMDAKDSQEFSEKISGEYAGIGAQVSKDPDDDSLRILRPIYGGPAYRLGLRSGDRITEVEGLPTVGHTLPEIVKRLKGTPGTPVQLMVFRRGWKEPMPFAIPREIIHLESVHFAMLPGKVGYLSLSQFGDDSVDEFRAALDVLEGEGMTSLIVDLRDNPGGYLQGATNIVDEFVDEDPRPIVIQRSKSNAFPPRSTFATKGMRPQVPLVILVNRGSASASEIVSGALQDFGRATLVGTKTFGKGSVQRLLGMSQEADERLGGRTTLRLTVQHYYLPSGRSIHAQRDEDGRVIKGKEGGVTPDLEVEPERVPLWRLEAVDGLAEAGVFDEYFDTYYEAHEETLLRLAEFGDGGSVEAYPGFREYISSRNKSNAQDEDIRWELRSLLRRKVEDSRGKQFACDYGDDVQLQRALIAALEKVNQSAATIPEYAHFADKFAKDGEEKDKAQDG